MTTPLTLSIFGASGSVGRKAVQVALADPDRFRVQVLTAGRDVAALVALGQRLGAAHLVVADDNAYQDLQDAVAAAGLSCTVAAGASAMVEAAAIPVDYAVSAIVGLAGLATTLELAANARVLAIANKESIVCGWPLLRAMTAAHNTAIIPLDSEHNSLFQLINPLPRSCWSSVTITASGGPFRGWNRQQLATVTPQQALNHPVWKMGGKISIDSATLANKGLEVMEAACLFDLTADQIEVLVHPQAQVHAMIQLKNGSRLTLASPPDMLYPLQHALYWPQVFDAPAHQRDWSWPALQFEAVDTTAFPALPLAYQALQAGHSAMMTYNIANEVAVEAFLAKKIDFLGISALIDRALTDFPLVSLTSFADIQDYDWQLRRRLADDGLPTPRAVNAQLTG
ncbi:MAG: 1-deoxy-D-xylulose-5-phosphate reductoisomerase [Alphaproteobacteria bacterium]|nr:1-deoxy-D-xylulose-5-phosphate reductoisomerase [Alphaproteobacteria bacterium]